MKAVIKRGRKPLPKGTQKEKFWGFIPEDTMTINGGREECKSLSELYLINRAKRIALAKKTAEANKNKLR
jgi:hypothetical protein